ncbi:flagellar basal body P-ring formation chaperone FlgA [Marinospirillum perlucidum]|uniref:flagellar basal body P-ring formation chaperone FlgA n=1 Tax=Marinospirillum perlucidum TaxID=1982602 RepID=UPI000DF3D3C3|nr:flagellar basal body P-ring formation chaperone FlgA [Marinospirillum perlucidum]
MLIKSHPAANKKPLKTGSWPLLLAFFLSLMATTAAATPYQDLDALQEEARTWINSQLDQESASHQIQFNTLDSSLRLQNCPAPLDFELHSNQELRGRTPIKVICDQANWFIYITADIQVMAQVVVAANHLARGSLVTGPQIRLEERDISRLRYDYFTDPQAVIGMEVKRRIQAGSILTGRQLNITQAVNAGDEVIIQARSSSLTIRITGEALEGGRIGDQIRVRNLQSGRIIRARILARGLVEVAL